MSIYSEMKYNTDIVNFATAKMQGVFTFVVILLVDLSVSRAGLANGPIYYGSNQYETNEETNDILDAIDKKFAKLEMYIGNHLNILHLATQEDINEKLQKLQKTLEQHLDEKLRSLEKRMYLEIADNNSNTINKKLVNLEKIIISLNTSKCCNMTSDSLKKFEGTLNKCNLMFDFEALNKSFTNLENNLNVKLTQIQDVIPKIEGNIERKLDVFVQKPPENVLAKLIAIEKRIDDSMQNKLDKLDEKLEQAIDHKIDAIQKKIPELEQNMNNKIDTLQNLGKNALVLVRGNQYLACKEFHTFTNSYASYIRMDDKSLTHVTYKKDPAGNYFEMHLAVMGHSSTYINVGSTADVKSEAYFESGIYEGSIAWFRNGRQLAGVNAPGIFNRTYYTPIYIKIYNGILELGKEGDSTPLMRYSDPALKTVGQFGFASVGGNATVLYDCPSINFSLTSGHLPFGY